MAWFSRRKEPPPPPAPEGRTGPPAPLPRTAETPGLALSAAGEGTTLGALFGLHGPAADLDVAAALHGAAGTLPVPGLAGMRVVFRDAETVVLRLGPPPGARWAVRDVRAVVVFGGKLAAVDGEELREIRAGTRATVARPAATLFLEAGNDAALALALAGPAFAATLG